MERRVFGASAAATLAFGWEIVLVAQVLAKLLSCFSARRLHF